MTPDAQHGLLWLQWALFASYALTALLGLGIAGLVRRHLPYYPAVVVLVVVSGLKGAYYAAGALPLFEPSLRAEFRQPLMELVVQLLILGGLAWTLVLVVLQNRADVRGRVDIDGRTHWFTPRFARDRASDALRAASAAEQKYGLDPRAEAESTFAGGWGAVQDFRNEQARRKAAGEDERSD